MTQTGYILATDCPDRTGVVAAISSFIADRNGLILEAAHHRDVAENRSYMRTEFSGDKLPSREELDAQFASLAAKFDMQWSLSSSAEKCKVLIAVSRQDHCLNSMLHRWSNGTLPIDVVGVVSNHDVNRRLVEWYGLNYHHFPIEDGKKHIQEKRVFDLFRSSGAELLVLARYMQILSPEMTDELSGCCINIHHSFLPGFKGARPYYQAYDRGVKLIGATSHYVTVDLDEGPIIEQAVERVDHTMNPQRLTEIGHDIESVVLNRAVRWHAEHRVFVNGNRTAILI